MVSRIVTTACLVLTALWVSHTPTNAQSDARQACLGFLNPMEAADVGLPGIQTPTDMQAAAGEAVCRLAYDQYSDDPYVNSAYGRMLMWGSNFQASFPMIAVAADFGLPSAEHNLGALYYRGVTGQEDYSTALAWFRRAANQGFVPSIHQVGVFFDLGISVPENDDEAEYWYRQAANQGYQPAIDRLTQFRRCEDIADDLDDLSDDVERQFISAPVSSTCSVVLMGTAASEMFLADDDAPVDRSALRGGAALCAVFCLGADEAECLSAGAYLSPRVLEWGNLTSERDNLRC